ncbi:RNA-binding protein 1-like isoform X1 [Sesamum indicum]|uniref:RNA-binding protein 1-like isoform X1 n=1 Tax=Sesamum indicum TaxID=4182 RepID=A0A6I9TGM4_SESIN|nr:RNA-binding protein 1-like isoform X1 [Sesamum indicum]XP_011084539.1 RNA-binding protein 1-like isoform X1 [Sesamum indicum]
MADAYWRYSDGRQQPAALTPHVVKRPRSDYEIPSRHDLSGYYAREDDRGGLRVIRDTDSINASYDRYLRSTQMPSYGGDSGRSMSSGLGGHHHVDDPRVMAVGGSEPAASTKIRSIGVEAVQPEISLPPDASSTLFVEGLPANCTRREVCHIFRPFVGYKEVRLVTKESRHPGGDPLVLCFVDFQSPAHAATAMDALQGYKFDEHDRDSAHLRIQFARHHGARSGGGHRGKR